MKNRYEKLTWMLLKKVQRERLNSEEDNEVHFSSKK